MKKAKVSWFLITIFIVCSVITPVAESMVNTDVLVNYENATPLQPVQTDEILVNDSFYVSDTEIAQDGTIFILGFLLDLPHVFYLIRYDADGNFTFIRHFSQVSYGINLLDDEIVILAKEYENEDVKIFHINREGEITSEIELNSVNAYAFPNRVCVSKDGFYYLIAFDRSDLGEHLIKLGEQGDIMWDQKISSEMLNYRHPVLLSNNQICLFNHTHLQSFDNNGNILWTKDLGNQSIWHSESIVISKDESIIVLSHWIDGWIYAGGNLRSYSKNGDFSWNASIKAKYQADPEEEFYLDLIECGGNSIFGLLSIDGAPENQYLFEISSESELLNLWSVDYLRLSTLRLEFNNKGEPVFIGVNRTLTERYLVALTYPQIIPQKQSNLYSIIVGSILITAGSVCIISVILIIKRKNLFQRKLD